MSSAKPFTVGGIGAQVSLDDVVKIAQGQPILLDPAASERVKKLSPAPKQFQPEAFTVPADLGGGALLRPSEASL